MKNKKYDTARTTSNQQIDTPNTYIHDHSFFGLGIGTSITSGTVKQFV